MRKVVVNTTPLIALAEIGELSLLRKLYSEIYIPTAVFDEIKSEPAYSEVRNNLDWIHVVEIVDLSKKKMFQTRLHAGEVEVMIYASEVGADLVILDDKLARRTAKYLDLCITGTIGVVLKAKQCGIIQKVRPIINKIVQNGLYISDELMDQIMKIAE